MSTSSDLVGDVEEDVVQIARDVFAVSGTVSVFALLPAGRKLLESSPQDVFAQQGLGFGELPEESPLDAQLPCFPHVIIFQNGPTTGDGT